MLAQGDEPKRFSPRGSQHLGTRFPKVITPSGPMDTAGGAKVQVQAYMCSHNMRVMHNNTAEEKQTTIGLTLERLHPYATVGLRLFSYTGHVEDRLNVRQVSLDWYNQSAPDTSMVRVQAMPSTSGPTTNLLFSASM